MVEDGRYQATYDELAKLFATVPVVSENPDIKKDHNSELRVRDLLDGGRVRFHQTRHPRRHDSRELDSIHTTVMGPVATGPEVTVFLMTARGVSLAYLPVALRLQFRGIEIPIPEFKINYQETSRRFTDETRRPFSTASDELVTWVKDILTLNRYLARPFTVLAK